MPTLSITPPLGGAASVRPQLGARRRAARSLLAFAGFVVAFNVALFALLEYGPPRLRDPEYGLRMEAARARQEADAARPFVVVLGSSRTAMGVRPDVLEADRPPFALFNFALAGSGPIMQRIVFRRALADGVAPAAVLVEFWPPFFREDSGYHEDRRFEVARLRTVDLPLIREHFADPAATERRMREQRRVPWLSHREALLQQFAGSWLPNARRTDGIWKDIDPWGWQVSKKALPEAARDRAFLNGAGYYAPLFARYQVSPESDAALRGLVADCRDRRIPVALVYLPESKKFRDLMPPEARRLADEYLQRIRSDLHLTLIDGRDWIDDRELPDGFHMTPDAAADFTRKLAPEVAKAFPELAR